MGLCKCPKRTVTNLFCFEHRVNVCEFCLVANHSKCVVQSYLKWLEDSDYNAVCLLCDQKLTDVGPTIRLACYHVFHQSCLDKFYASLPENTAPAGFICAVCSEPLFPPENHEGPVIQALRSHLKTQSWAREGLGLPLFERAAPLPQALSEADDGAGDSTQNDGEIIESEGEDGDLVKIVTHHPAFMPSQLPVPTAETSYREKFSDRGRKADDDQILPDTTVKKGDSDENKYARKSLLTLVSNFMKAHQITPLISSHRLPNRKLFRFGLYAFFLLLFLLTTVAVLQTLSRYLQPDDSQDPMLNPRLNPNIRIE
ncbi:zinc finger protein-like 1 homolog [Convolutriloba macropyga]|uniref:zinc finger protein-like 1 homolog n=1 Tax=Convolutriloba macropyga TaxID=536237 RepID=UPI003F51BBEB